MTAYFVLFAALMGGWFWFDTMKIRERANVIARQSCEKADVQFLDGTVSFAKISIINTADGLRLRRVFVFDYSENAENRKQGFLVFSGTHVTAVGFQPREMN